MFYVGVAAVWAALAVTLSVMLGSRPLWLPTLPKPSALPSSRTRKTRLLTARSQPSGRPSEEEIRWAQAKGLLAGFPEGEIDYRPSNCDI